MKQRWKMTGVIVFVICGAASIGNNNKAAIACGVLALLLLGWFFLTMYLTKKNAGKAKKPVPAPAEVEPEPEEPRGLITDYRFSVEKAPVVGAAKLADRSGFDAARIGDRVFLSFAGQTNIDRKAIEVFDRDARSLGFISKKSKARLMCYDWFRRDERMEAYVDGVERNEAVGQNTLVTLFVKYE